MDSTSTTSTCPLPDVCASIQKYRLRGATLDNNRCYGSTKKHLPAWINKERKNANYYDSVNGIQNAVPMAAKLRLNELISILVRYRTTVPGREDRGNPHMQSNTYCLWLQPLKGPSKSLHMRKIWDCLEHISLRWLPLVLGWPCSA